MGDPSEERTSVQISSFVSSDCSMIAVGISSSDDDSLLIDRHPPGLSLELYRSLELNTALSQPENYVRAVQELAAVVEALPRFGRPGRKATASEIINDALLAVDSCNGWLGCLSALARLVAACSKQPLLPQQRVRRLTREHKRIAVTFARLKGDCSLPPGRFLDLPQACLDQVCLFLLLCTGVGALRACLTQPGSSGLDMQWSCRSSRF